MIDIFVPCKLHYALIRIGGVMVCIFAPSEADGSSPGLGQTKDYQTGIRCLNANHAALKERAKTGWLEIRIMCRSQNTCQSSECCL